MGVFRSVDCSASVFKKREGRGRLISRLKTETETEKETRLLENRRKKETFKKI